MPVEPNPEYSGYPTTDQLVAGSTNPALNAASTDEQEAYREAAIVAVEEYCNQRFEPNDDTIYVDGTGKTTLFLPTRLSSLETIVVRGAAISASDILIGPKHDHLTIKPVSGAGYYERAMADLDRDPRNFVAGDATVAITGTWGWAADEFPEAITVAIRMDMEDNATADANALAPTVAAMRQLGLRSMQQGRMSVQLAPASVVALSLRAQRLLGRGFVWTPLVSAAV